MDSVLERTGHVDGLSCADFNQGRRHESHNARCSSQKTALLDTVTGDEEVLLAQLEGVPGHGLRDGPSCRARPPPTIPLVFGYPAARVLATPKGKGCGFAAP